MKRFLVAGALVAGLTVVPVSAAVASPQTTASVQQSRLDDVKAKVDAAIQRRLDALGRDATRAGDANHLTAADHAALTALISDDQSGLTALKTKVDADPDLASVVADAKSVVDDYRVFVLVEPQVHLTIAADRGLAIVDRFHTIAGTLQTAIDTQKQQGKDVSAAQASLDDMNAKVGAASTSLSGIPAQVLALTPAGYPGNVDTLKAARSSLQSARDDLKAARTDAGAVISALR